jgi:RNA polymerase sigma-70 factor (ECF subfamily)
MDDRGQRLAKGDQTAFAELYDACAAPVHRYLVVRLGSRTDAEDVLQETFVGLARTRHKLAAVQNLNSYVFAAARNEAARLMERRAREARQQKTFALEALVLPSETSELTVRETAEWVADSLDALSEPLREVVILKIYGDLTLREIGEVIGVPQGTVATRYRTALEKLRGQLMKERQ